MAFERFDTKSTDPKNQKFANASKNKRGASQRTNPTQLHHIYFFPSKPTHHP